MLPFALAGCEFCDQIAQCPPEADWQAPDRPYKLQKFWIFHGCGRELSQLAFLMGASPASEPRMPCSRCTSAIGVPEAFGASHRGCDIR